MKTIKTLFAILFLSTMFIACETESVNDEVGLDEIETVGSEDAGGDESLNPDGSVGTN